MDSGLSWHADTPVFRSDAVNKRSRFRFDSDAEVTRRRAVRQSAVQSRYNAYTSVAIRETVVHDAPITGSDAASAVPVRRAVFNPPPVSDGKAARSR